VKPWFNKDGESIKTGEEWEEASMRESRGLNKFASWVAGYDIFISYRHAEAHDYAQSLERILESRGLMVFRDESEEDSGVSLNTFIKRACAARALIVVATPNVYESSNVLAELSGYLENRIGKWYRRPFSRVISVNVNQALSNAPSEPGEWRRLSDFVYEPENLEAVSSGNPSPQLVERLSRASSFMRSWRRFVLVMATVVLAIFLSIAGGSVYLRSVVHALTLNKVALSVAQGESTRLQQSNQLLNGENDALKTSTISLRNESTALTNANTILTGQNKDLKSQTTQLQSKADRLTSESTMLQTRIAAQKRLAEDPLVAYRLAQAAYALTPDHDNRKLILSALSKIDLFYGYEKNGYAIEDFKEPFILLGRQEKQRAPKEFLVFNMTTRKVQAASPKGDHAWIVPLEKSWRLITANFRSDSTVSDSTVYELWDENGNVLGEAANENSILFIEFLTPAKVSIPVRKEAKTLVWDLIKNTRQTVDIVSDESNRYVREIPLSMRKDGISAGSYRSGLVLMNLSGKIEEASYTAASFDPLFSTARWSSDDRYLALNYTETKRLGVWDPLVNFFIWLDAKGWIAECYSWSHKGHLLAFGGRTENQTDVTVELVDAGAPEQSRRVIYRGEVPIRAITFVPGDEQLAISDRNGNIFIVQISTGQLLGKGHQEGVNQLFSTQAELYSSGVNEFRAWSISPSPGKHWLFQSSADRTYSATGAADPSWKWLAVPYVNGQNGGGIELRNITSGETKLLPSSSRQYTMSLKFSDDGRWLVWETRDNLRVYETSSWVYRDFQLQEKDGQFISLSLQGETAYAHVLGRGWMDDTSKEYDYVIKLNENPLRVADTIRRKENTERSDKTPLLRDMEGWESGTLYKYQSYGVFSAPASGWAVSVKCRDEALGAQDCDVQFVPIDLNKTMNVYDVLLWKPTNRELKDWLR
jgi:TIR domain